MLTDIEHDIEKYDTQLDIMNGFLVASIRAQVYRERLGRGESLDNEASSWLYCMPKTFGTEQHMSQLRLQIVETIELRIGAISLRDSVEDAMHRGMHEVLGECMYQFDEDYDEETGKYEPILSKPCNVWFPNG
jgi:hypothetical protein